MRFYQFREFENWYSDLSMKDKLSVDARLYRVEENTHFGNTRFLGDGIAEMRWKNGLRLYFAKGSERNELVIYLILGGTKHGQQKDIQKAKILLRRYGIGKA